MSWKITVRTGGKVRRARLDALNAALEHVQTEARAAADGPPRQVIDTKIRAFEPVQQVVARIELAGPERVLPKVRAGIDVRGDGSAEAYLGRVKRRVIEPRRRESPYDALRRELVGFLEHEG